MYEFMSVNMTIMVICVWTFITLVNNRISDVFSDCLKFKGLSLFKLSSTPVETSDNLITSFNSELSLFFSIAAGTDVPGNSFKALHSFFYVNCIYILNILRFIWIFLRQIIQVNRFSHKHIIFFYILILSSVFSQITQNLYALSANYSKDHILLD